MLQWVIKKQFDNKTYENCIKNLQRAHGLYFIRIIGPKIDKIRKVSVFKLGLLLCKLNCMFLNIFS